MMLVPDKAIVTPGKAKHHIYTEDPKEFGRWLSRAIHLKANRITEKIEVIELGEMLFEELGLDGRNRNFKKHALNCMLANLFLAAE